MADEGEKDKSNIPESKLKLTKVNESLIILTGGLGSWNLVTEYSNLGGEVNKSNDNT